MRFNLPFPRPFVPFCETCPHAGGERESISFSFPSERGVPEGRGVSFVYIAIPFLLMVFLTACATYIPPPNKGSNLPFLLRQAQTQHLMGHLTEALVLYDQFIQESSSSPAGGEGMQERSSSPWLSEALLRAGQCAYALEKYNQAWDYLNRLKQQTLSSDLQGAMDDLEGDLYTASSRFPEAQHSYAQALSTGSSYFKRDFIQLKLAKAYLRSENWEQGLQVLNTLSREAPGSEGAVFLSKYGSLLSEHVFYIQAGAFKSYAHAQDLEQRLTQRGFPGRVLPVDSSTKGNYSPDSTYMDLVGPYRHWPDAQRASTALTQQGVSNFVIP